MFSAEDLPVRRHHVTETFLARIKDELPIVMARVDYRERVRGYLNAGGNPNLLFPRTTTDRTYEWGFLHLAVAKAASRSRDERAEQDQDVDLIRFLIGKIDVNARDSHKRTALHLAAYKGPGKVVEVLLQDGGAHPLCFDRLRLLPTDYHSLAQVFEGATIYQLSRLIEAEGAEVNRVYAANDKKEKAAFIRAFEQSCSTTQLSYKLLGARILAKDSNKLSVSNFLNLMSTVLPSPAALGAQGLAVVASFVEQSQEESSRQKYVNNFEKILNKETIFRNVAYWLANLYGTLIQEELTEQGAADLGRYAAKKVNRFLASDDFDGFYFIEQIEKMLQNVEMGTFNPTKVESKRSQEGICACTIFNPNLQKRRANAMEIAAIELTSGHYSYDREEEARLEALVRVEVPVTEETDGSEVWDLSHLFSEKSLLETLRDCPSERTSTVTSLNLAHNRVTTEVVECLQKFSDLRFLGLARTNIEQDALQKIGQLTLNHLVEVDWRGNSSISINKTTLSFLSCCLDSLNSNSPHVKHLLDNDTVYKLGQYHEENGVMDKALHYYELGGDSLNKLAFIKLSTQRSRNDDHVFRREYRCLSDLVAMNDSHGQYLMAHLYKSAKDDTIRNLKALGVVPATMSDSDAKKDLMLRTIDLYRLAAEGGGHTRAAKALAQMHDARKPQISVPRPRGGHPDARYQLEEELKYWKIAAQGQRGVLDGSREYVESAPENIARVEEALRQITKQ